MKTLGSRMTLLTVKILAILSAVHSFALGNHHRDRMAVRDPPCFFNPLCICSKSYPDLGRVTCKNIPMLNVPQQINMSKVFMLHMENNGLRHIEPHFLGRTGLFKIEITRNLLKKLDEESFAGLERSLSELNLHNNRLTDVPGESMRRLQKLKHLDLSENEITSVRPEDWSGLENSLKTLLLWGNRLSSLRPKTFSGLRQLETLDLSKNKLLELDAFAFKGGTLQLRELNLADNLFTEIPLVQISELRELRHLDMSFNQITEIQDSRLDRNKGKSANLFLDTLRLDYNQIQYLPDESFTHFPVLNRTYLNGNPIVYIEKGAFHRTKIRELYLEDCEISDLTTDAFSGLEPHLEILNVAGNNLTTVPEYFFRDFKLLKSLDLRYNFIAEFDIDQMTFPGERTSLQQLHVTGQMVTKGNSQNGDKLNVRSLSIYKFPESSLSSNDLQGFFNQLEDLKLSYSNVRSLKNHVFKYVRGLRRLDLSENSISNVENKAFSGALHSLQYLSLSNGLSSSLTQLPADVFDDLTSLEILDLSNNGLKKLPEKLFDSMKRLKVILLQDNFIEYITRKTFQENIHSELETIQLSFNQLSSVDGLTFNGLGNLRGIWLNDNRIAKVDRKAFANLYQLRQLTLRGNQITTLADESFQDLPELEKLDLAYNKLKVFNYGCLEQVGTLSSFTLNVSFNQIEQLAVNADGFDSLDSVPEHVNIKAMDLSHNNISFLKPTDFKPIEPSVTHLLLSHNNLENVTRNTFGSLAYLQWLDVSHNRLTDIEYDAFANTKSIQVLYLSNNRLREIPKFLFNGFHHLRVVDVSSNELRTLPENLFVNGVVERLDLSNNRLVKVPIFCFYGDSGKTLSELDLSGNSIANLPSSDAFAKFKNLYSLNLARNRIARLDPGTFSYLNKLVSLDLSHNPEINLDSQAQVFYGLGDTLENLVLRNLSITTIPSLHLPFLDSLDLSENHIHAIPFEFPHNLTNLRKLELANNRMTIMPPAVNAFTNLEYLGISGNPFETVNFQQSFTIRELDLRNISLDVLQKGALGKIPFLENLMLTVNETNQDLNLPNLVKENHGLNHLYVDVSNNRKFSLADEMSGWFPVKLRNLTLSGRGLYSLPGNLLEGVRNPNFNLFLLKTSVKEIDQDVFRNGKRVRNLTLNVVSNKLESVSNPNTADEPNTPKKLFLLDLHTSNNNWMCDCSIGWMEGWDRKRRRYLCLDDLTDCFAGSDDLRSAVCSDGTGTADDTNDRADGESNSSSSGGGGGRGGSSRSGSRGFHRRHRKTLSDAFKTDLECGWNSSGNLHVSLVLEFAIINIYFLFNS